MGGSASEQKRILDSQEGRIVRAHDRAKRQKNHIAPMAVVVENTKGPRRGRETKGINGRKRIITGV